MGTLTVYLLDTCAFYWLCAQPKRLPGKLARTLEAEGDQLHLSLVTHIEVSNLWLAGKMRIPYTPRRWLQEQVTAWKVALVRIEAEDIYRASELPNYHRDPFDRLLIAQAQLRNMILVTPDEIIHRYPVSSLW